MSSRIYVGGMMHARLEPVRHSFEYPIYLLALDLDELSTLDRDVPLFGYNRARPVSLWDRDYLDAGPGSVRDKLMKILARRGCDDDVASVRLLTVGRCFGYAFNPLSVYYCFRGDGSLRCAVAEVNNTFEERHVYVLDAARPAEEPRPGFLARLTATKEFFVSPFNDLTGEYQFHVGALEDQLKLQIDLVRNGRVAFRSGIWGRARPLCTWSLLCTLLRYPLSAALVVPRITWQALVLRWKGLRVLMKPTPASEMTIRTSPPRRRVHRAASRQLRSS